DMGHSSYSRALTQAVAATQVVDFTHRYDSSQEAEAAITRGEVKAVLYLPADLGQRLLQRADSREDFARPIGQWLVDGSDTMVASAIRGLRLMPLGEVLGFGARQPSPSLEVVQYFNPEQRTVVNIVPGLLGVILTMTMVLF